MPSNRMLWSQRARYRIGYVVCGRALCAATPDTNRWHMQELVQGISDSFVLLQDHHDVALIPLFDPVDIQHMTIGPFPTRRLRFQEPASQPRLLSTPSRRNRMARWIRLGRSWHGSLFPYTVSHSRHTRYRRIIGIEFAVPIEAQVLDPIPCALVLAGRCARPRPT